MQLNLLNCLVLLLIVLAVVESCTGARSGGRSSSRYSSRYSSYRSRSRYGSSKGTSYSTLALMVNKRFSYRVNRLAYSRGIFFSTWSWRRGHLDYSDSASLCFNVVDSLPAEYNSSVVVPWLYQNRSVYGLFVCPVDADRQDRVYCCGDEESQRCCSFTEDSGRIIGLCIGLIVCCTVVGFVAYRFYQGYLRRKNRASQQQSAAVAVAHIGPALHISSDAASAADLTAPATIAGYPASADSGAGGGADWANKPHEQPFNYYGDEHLLPPPPYPTAPQAQPPAYWEVNSPEQAQMTPVRF